MLLLVSSVCGLFKWRQFEPEVILLAVGWYLRFSLSYRDVEEQLATELRPLWWSSMNYCCEPEIASNQEQVTQRVENTVRSLAKTIATDWQHGALRAGYTARQSPLTWDKQYHSRD